MDVTKLLMEVDSSEFVFGYTLKKFHCVGFFFIFLVNIN